MSFEEHRDWCDKNQTRLRELCAALDAAGNFRAQKALFETFTHEERDGMSVEWWRRCVNNLAPVGSLVGPKDRRSRYEITCRSGNSELSAVTASTATVIGQEDGLFKRYLMLHVPWRDLEGRVLRFVEASAHELKAYVTHDE